MGDFFHICWLSLTHRPSHGPAPQEHHLAPGINFSWHLLHELQSESGLCGILCAGPADSAMSISLLCSPSSKSLGYLLQFLSQFNLKVSALIFQSSHMLA